MAETSTRWREALADNNHPLYKAAWLVFTDRISTELAFGHLKDAQEAVVPFLNELLADDGLFDNDSPGKGVAPANAVRLLGEYQAREALPKILELYADTTNYPMRSACVYAVGKFGSDVLDQIIEWAGDDGARRPKAAELMVEIGEGNEKAFNTLLGWIHPDVSGLEYYARYLTKINPEAAITTLEKLSKDPQFNGDVRRRFKDRIKEAQQAIKAKQEAS
ncbi:MAG: HEAT repeat domain-containing protein [Chloroflexi bacterium]|nr:HEAT repeat domain-containing protein [Chloroflexota bacterium]